ncbi:MAG: acyl carrier protein [Treponema sp.]|nr:acyl carrier protein [Treponema sp.]
MTKEAIFGKIKETLISVFEIEAGAITPEANLVTDLDLDSIDAVDLIVKMKELIPGKNINPDLFKTVKTVQDVVEVLYPLTQN